MRNGYTILAGKLEGMREFGNHRRRLVDNIKINLKGIWI
jgi:hypothetical protein